MHSSSRSGGLRKGAWTEEEDRLLRNCIQKYGEGKWHQVPHRAGLNRCRKSCRLRWLNYLRPNIKRGNFDLDEIDLIIRLHKLLGNRWSLIAGRLPGRTANDVKNYWNTHMKKKEVTVNGSSTREAAAACAAAGAARCISCRKTTTTATNTTDQAVPKKKSATTIIKPRPRSFSKNSPWLRQMITTSTADDNVPSQTAARHQNQNPPPAAIASDLETLPKLPVPVQLLSSSSQLQQAYHHDLDMQWLENLFNEEDVITAGASNPLTDFGEDRISNQWLEETWCGFVADGRRP